MIKEIFQHRSIRKYKSDAIPQSVLNEVLQAATKASNTGNMQLYSIVVSTTDEVKEKLSPAHFNQPMIKGAPVVLTFCADVSRVTKWCAQRNADAGFYNVQTIVGAIIDASLAAQNACLEAEAHGLGICYLGTTTYNAQQIIDVLHLPKGVVPVTTVTIGYPAEEQPLTSRLPLSAVVHSETYHDYSETDIDAIYSEMENNPDNQKFITENNKQNLAQVFSEVRYSRSNNEFFSKEFLAALQKQGIEIK